MPQVFFSPGPSQLYPSVSKHLEQALQEQIFSISHRSEQFMEIFAECKSNLRTLLNIPDDYRIFFYSSATEVWERLLQYYPGKGFFFVNGSFSNRFKSFADKLEHQVATYEVPFGEGFERGKAHLPNETGICGMIGNETSTGVQTPVEDYYLVADANPEVACFIDLVSAYPTYAVDLSKLSGAYFSVQKGFGLPAGLGVLIMSPGAFDLAGKVGEAGCHRHLSEMEAKRLKNQTSETPNVLAIYLLAKVAGDMIQRGTELHGTAKAKAELIYAYFDQHPKYSPAVDTPRLRSETILVIDTPKQAPEIIEKMKNLGFVVGSGYGQQKEDQIRIASFPATSLDEVKALLKAFDKVLA